MVTVNLECEEEADTGIDTDLTVMVISTLVGRVLLSKDVI